MMRQYQKIKAEHPGCLLFYRLGDFYELFFEDAKTAAPICNLALTGRECGLEERAPMCGVPHHAYEGYVQKLVDAGHHVAICEQLEDPKNTKGMLKRGVTRVVTAGTFLANSNLEPNSSIYIMCLCMDKTQLGYAVADVSTGAFFCGAAALPQNETGPLLDLLTRIQPREIIGDSSAVRAVRALKQNGLWEGAAADPCSEWWFIEANARDALCKHFRCKTLAAFGVEEHPSALSAAGALMQYLAQTQKTALPHLCDLRFEHQGAALMLDANTRRNLELTRPLNGSNKRATLLHVLDRTDTPMGARCLRDWLETPLYDLAAIQTRQDAVEALFCDPAKRAALKDALTGIRDLERLSSKLSYGTFNARDAAALGQSFSRLGDVKAQAEGSELLNALNHDINAFASWAEKLRNAIDDMPPVSIREGGMFRPGYNTDLDEMRALAQGGKDAIAALEAAEREETGIKTLKIGYNRVFGYYIEVTKANASNVPYRYQRRQTLAGNERYVTPELKELEQRVLQAGENQMTLEYAMFCKLRDSLAADIKKILQTAAAVGQCDALCSFAEAAALRRYTKPRVVASPVLQIKQGRHPVIEAVSAESFVANDCFMNACGLSVSESNNSMIVLTGPNMAGKSTYIRQTALIALMAQIGSFVPAESAVIGLCDRIFTRVGASDELASGQSTFMVEMRETATILRNATPNSLVILDEIGRGTATHDGLAIAWAVVEYLLQVQARTLFATHYHELTELENTLEGVENHRVAVAESDRGLAFLHRIERGGADQSYGIHVAQLAGVPVPVVQRAWALLHELRASDAARQSGGGKGEIKELPPLPPLAPPQKTHPAVEKLISLDVLHLTPMQAINTLAELKELCE